MLNPHIPEAAQLTNAGQQLPLLTQAPSQAYSENASGILNALSNPLCCKTVAEIQQEKQAGNYRTVATVTEIIEDNNRWYRGCTECKKTIIKVQD
ncbi:hypothetical protein RIF29_08910 [Crotalaria pallida]|uniref:Uncharacterized protein n=1 Tax=Crotalaria pallida TaxID=3830 RepID=A0AAN9IHL5_CROPI